MNLDLLYLIRHREDILDITKKGEVPISTSSTAFSVFDAIKAKNYLLALNLSYAHAKETGILNEDRSFHILLVDINKLNSLIYAQEL